MIQVRQLIRSFQQFADFLVHGPRFPFPNEALLAHGGPSSQALPSKTSDFDTESFLESLKDGFLWGVPKKRRSVEKRLVRKHGCTYMAPYKPKTNLIVCLHCGHHHEAHSICGNCYNKIKEETTAIQEAMNIKQRTSEHRDIVVLYEGDVREAELAESKRIVEIPKPRPSWFPPTLMSKAIGRRE